MNADEARAWLQEAIDDRPEGAYEGRFFSGESEIFQFLLDRLDELEAGEAHTEWGVLWPDESEPDILQDPYIPPSSSALIAAKGWAGEGGQLMRRKTRIGLWTAVIPPTTSESPS